MRFQRKNDHLWSIVGVCIGAGLFFPAAASAAQTIGSTAGSTDNCSQQSFVQKTTGVGTPYSPSSGGVITQWRYLAGANTPMVRAKVYGSVNLNTYFLKAQSPSRAASANVLNTFTESPGIPIAAGDRLGLTGQSGGQIGCNPNTGDPDDVVRSNWINGGGDTILNQNNTFDTEYQPGVRVDISATVEPDGDGDGYGDETQDACPTDPATHLVACASPGSGSGQPSGQQTGSGVLADKTAPSQSVVASSTQSLRSLSLSVTLNEAGTLTVGGTLNIPGGAAKTFRIKPVTKAVAANVKTKIRVRLSRKAIAAAKRALKRHKKVRAKLTVTAQDSSGNTNASSTSVRLRP